MASSFLSGPEPFIKPLVKSIRSEFKPPSRALYKKVREDIIHRVADLNLPVSLDILPVTAIDVAPVLPPVPFGSLTDFGRRLGISEVASLERSELRTALHREKTRASPRLEKKPPSLRKKTPLPAPAVSESLDTPLLATSLPDIPTDSQIGNSLEISSPKKPLSKSRVPTAALTHSGPSKFPASSRVRKFSPEISSPAAPPRRTLENSSVVEIFPEEQISDLPIPAPVAAQGSDACRGVRVTLDLSMDGQDGGQIGNLLELEELLSDAERLLRGERITEEEISRELRLLNEISDSRTSDLRNSWSDIEAELDRLRAELKEPGGRIGN